MFGAEDQQDDTRIEAVLAEYLRRIDQGENVDHEQFIAEHPAFSEPLRDYFETAAKIARMAGLPEATLDSDAQSGKSESALAVVRYFGDYELFDVIARGGMGVVYRARQVSLNRVVALKMILAGKLADEADVSRFHAEAEAAAILDHPGIVPIYEIGDHKGQHYFSMGYVDGESLSGRIKDGPLPPREAAAYMLKIAEAVAFAHEHGVIHRDLKPSNVLLDRAGELKVSDFGLAKRVQSDSDLTATGQVLGTPSYMPPEQASGEVDDITALSDIYSLGATCYCLLTGNPPFAAASAVETLRQVVETEPIPPKDVNPDVDLDLQTITLKCLEKRPERRYASARELAAELERFLNGEPIHARPISAMDRLWRWCKRRPKVAGLTAAVVLMALFIAIVSPLVALRQESLRRDADKRAQEAQAARGQARTSQSKAEKRERVANRYLYDAHMNLAMLAWEEGNVPRVRQLLDLHLPQSDEDDTRTFVWYYLHNLCETKHVRVLNHGAPVSCVAFSPDSATLASSSADGIVRLWNPTSGQSKLTIRTRALGSSAVDFSPDGTTLAISFPPRATALLDVASGKIKTTIDRRGGHPAAIAFSPDGAIVATGSDNNTVRLWE
jgi:tRNA A-37 threonylcarbamoyl transferase component Bud32